MTEEIKNTIIKEYTNNLSISILDLSRKYHLGPKTIKKIFTEKGIELKNRNVLLKRKYSCHDTIFDNPENWTSDVAYFFGWMQRWICK